MSAENDSLELAWATRDAHLLVTLRGQLTDATAMDFLARVRSSIDEQDAAFVILDLAEAGRVEGEGLRVIQTLDHECRARDGALLCAQMSLEIEIALRQAGLAVALRLPSAWPRRQLA